MIGVSEAHRVAVDARARRKSQGRACSRVPGAFCVIARRKLEIFVSNPWRRLSESLITIRRMEMDHAQIGQASIRPVLPVAKISEALTERGRGSVWIFRLFLFVL